MGWNRGKDVKHCRWCGVLYYACQPITGDGFCCPAHKQAHYRAYKKWVTTAKISASGLEDQRVTPKKSKKKG